MRERRAINSSKHDFSDTIFRLKQRFMQDKARCRLQMSAGIIDLAHPAAQAGRGVLT